MPKEKPLNGEAAEPTPRGGGRHKHPRAPGETSFEKPGKGQHPNSLANIAGHAWKPGQSGNPTGRAKSLFEVTRAARELCPAAISKLKEIITGKASNRDKLSAIAIILERGLGRPLAGSEHIGFGDMAGASGGIPYGMTPLLIDAGRRGNAAYKMELQAELRRLEIEEEQRRDARADALAEARAAMAAGEPVDPMMSMLIQTRDAKS